MLGSYTRVFTVSAFYGWKVAEGRHKWTQFQACTILSFIKWKYNNNTRGKKYNSVQKKFAANSTFFNIEIYWKVNSKLRSDINVYMNGTCAILRTTNEVLPEHLFNKDHRLL